MRRVQVCLEDFRSKVVKKCLGKWLVRLHTRWQLRWDPIARKEPVQRIECPLLRLPPRRFFFGFIVNRAIGTIVHGCTTIVLENHGFLHNTQHERAPRHNAFV